MVSQFFGLNIAASGLRAANAALNTTANNISNVETKGYSRQKVNQEAADALRVFAKYGCAGAGVETIAIERVRDSFYDVKYRNNEQLLGNVEQKNYYTKLVEQYLDDDGTTGFSSLFTKMEAALQSVKTAAGTTEAKTTYVSSVRSITEYFNNVYNQLQGLQSDINSEIKLCADRISSISQEVASINKQINIIEMTGTTANELRDKLKERNIEVSITKKAEDYILKKGINNKFGAREIGRIFIKEINSKIADIIIDNGADNINGIEIYCKDDLLAVRKKTK